jgi:hypothetical protein
MYNKVANERLLRYILILSSLLRTLQIVLHVYLESSLFVLMGGRSFEDSIEGNSLKMLFPFHDNLLVGGWWLLLFGVIFDVSHFVASNWMCSRCTISCEILQQFYFQLQIRLIIRDLQKGPFMPMNT